MNLKELSFITQRRFRVAEKRSSKRKERWHARLSSTFVLGDKASLLAAEATGPTKHVAMKRLCYRIRLRMLYYDESNGHLRALVRVPRTITAF